MARFGGYHLDDKLEVPDPRVPGLAWKVETTAFYRSGRWELDVLALPLWEGLDLEDYSEATVVRPAPIRIEVDGVEVDPDLAPDDQVADTIRQFVTEQTLPPLMDASRAALRGAAGEEAQLRHAHIARQYSRLRSHL